MGDKILFIIGSTNGADIFDIISEKLEKDQYLKYYEIEIICLNDNARCRIRHKCSKIDIDDKMDNAEDKMWKCNILDYIDQIKPEFVINESSGEFESQNKITRYCKKKNITNISIMDMFDYYSLRYDKNCLPDYIIVPNKEIEDELENEIVILKDTPKVKIAPHPKFEYILEDIPQNNNFEEAYIQKKLNRYLFYKTAKEPYLNILYVSTTITEKDKCNYGKIDQYQQFELLYSALEKSKLNFKIFIKTYPGKEDDEQWKKELENHCKAFIIRSDSNHCNDRYFYTQCARYDLAVGYYSTLLVEMILIGLPTIFMRYIYDIYIDLDVFFLSLKKELDDKLGKEKEFENEDAFYNCLHDKIDSKIEGSFTKNHKKIISLIKKYKEPHDDANSSIIEIIKKIIEEEKKP